MAGTSSHSMLGGIILFFITEIIALTIAVIGGSTLDMLEGQFYAMGWYDNIPSQWNTSAGENQLVNIFYAMPYIIGLLGIFILFVTIWQRFGHDEEEDPEDYNEYRSDEL